MKELRDLADLTIHDVDAGTRRVDIRLPGNRNTSGGYYGLDRRQVRPQPYRAKMVHTARVASVGHPSI